MGKPFLKFTSVDNYKRIDGSWKILKGKIEKEYRNFLFAGIGLGAFARDPLPWEAPGKERKIFYPTDGQLTPETWDSILIALQMLHYTIIRREKVKNPESELLKAWDTVFKYFTQNKA